MKFGNLVEICLWPHLAVKGVSINAAKVKHVVLRKKKEKLVILQPYRPVTGTSPQRSLSTVPKVAIVERFDYNCNQILRT